MWASSLENGPTVEALLKKRGLRTVRDEASGKERRDWLRAIPGFEVNKRSGSSHQMVTRAGRRSAANSLTCSPPLYLKMEAHCLRRNLFMKKFTRERVVPTIISASVSCEILRE